MEKIMDAKIQEFLDANNNKSHMHLKCKDTINYLPNVKNLNPHLTDIECDNLYHINLKNIDLQEKFGDVKFVCMG
jgi:hypothetical protein